VGVFDLRLLGMAKGLQVGPLQRLMPWGIGGFVINFITGAMFLRAIRISTSTTPRSG